MKLLSIFSAILFLSVTQSLRKSNEFLLRKAFSAIVKQFPSKNFYVSVVSENLLSEASKAAAFLTSAKPHVTFLWNKNKSETFELNSTAIIILDSTDSLNAFNNHTTFPLNYAISEQLIFYLQNATADDLLEILISKFETSIIKHEYLFMIEDDKSFQLLTFIWYKPQKCGKAELVEVNRFDKLSKKWQHKRFKINKFSNFHGCRIDFAIPTGMPGFVAMKFDNRSETITECMGYICAMLRDFSSMLNYTYHMDVFEHNGRKKFPNKPSHLSFRVSLLSWYHAYSQEQSRNAGIMTRPVHESEVFIAIPPGELYNSYEKLVLPFDGPTWFWIGVTFAAAFFTIFVLSFVRPEIANFVIGRGVETPVLNVLRAFFGISQINCPGRNFARYHLMLFILFSLIIRTAYQGIMFKFLQQEIRKPTVTNIDQMIDQNFTFYLQRFFKDFYQSLDFTKR